ncbi:ribokinase [Clostridium sp. MCC353]|uniref:ribokinase n=1 Tax=Clostridium sp. MCC353 TaxID=2592646 RepID=UPI001C026C72|nr:ribokinase [Clostridium sp. MCC353]MBT9775829.1 ribokinase [Clostridium sp. MCC353]
MNEMIVVAGSLNMDMVTHVDHIPRAGETILGGDAKMVPGGKGANQAYAAGKLGGRVVMLGAAGTDSSGDQMVNNLNTVRVDTSRIQRSGQVTSGAAWICVNSEGNNAIVVIPGANQCCDASYIRENRQVIEDCGYLLVQLEIPMEAAVEAISIAHGAGRYVILNPAPGRDDIPREIFRMVDLITPNETELFQLTGESASGTSMEEIERQAQKVLELGVGKVLVTLGEKGSLLVGPEGKKRFEAPRVKAVDTTAAGDCFNGALAVRLAEGAGLEDAVRFAGAASAIAVQREGAQTSIPDRSEIE